MDVKCHGIGGHGGIRDLFGLYPRSGLAPTLPIPSKPSEVEGGRCGYNTYSVQCREMPAADASTDVIHQRENADGQHKWSKSQSCQGLLLYFRSGGRDAYPFTVVKTAVRGGAVWLQHLR
jgi:hypothetical protein